MKIIMAGEYLRAPGLPVSLETPREGFLNSKKGLLNNYACNKSKKSLCEYQEFP